MVTEPSSRAKGDRPLIILLGGAPGTGKTTIANVLLEELGLSHHLSTGFIRASIAHLLPEQDALLLRHHTYDAYKALPDGASTHRSPLLQGAVQQSLLLRSSVETCIKRAHRDGIEMVLEGSHFIPGILDPGIVGARLLCIMDVPDREELKRRALSPAHSRRRLSEEQLERLVQLQDEILALARIHNQPVIVNDDLTKGLDQIRSLVRVQA